MDQDGAPSPRNRMAQGPEPWAGSWGPASGLDAIELLPMVTLVLPGSHFLLHHEEGLGGSTQNSHSHFVRPHWVTKRTAWGPSYPIPVPSVKPGAVSQANPAGKVWPPASLFRRLLLEDGRHQLPSGRWS